ncbi:UNVERIFIED_CONTAM: hypothetical protein Cloal_2521 [Acetivibrio alkalicellulosi]
MKKILLEKEIFKDNNRIKAGESNFIIEYNLNKHSGNILYKFADIYFIFLKIFFVIFIGIVSVYFVLRFIGLDIYPPLGNYAASKAQSILSSILSK